MSSRLVPTRPDTAALADLVRQDEAIRCPLIAELDGVKVVIWAVLERTAVYSLPHSPKRHLARQSLFEVDPEQVRYHFNRDAAAHRASTLRGTARAWSAKRRA
jgi:hypothetical protein